MAKAWNELIRLSLEESRPKQMFITMRMPTCLRLCNGEGTEVFAVTDG